MPTKKTAKKPSKKPTKRPAVAKGHVSRAARLADQAAQRAEAMAAVGKKGVTAMTDAAASVERRQVFGRRATDQMLADAAVKSARTLEQAQAVLAEVHHEIAAVAAGGPVGTAVRAIAADAGRATERAVRQSVTAVAEALIKAGKTNEEVLAALARDFGLDATAKRHYPGWYRARLVREGVITKKFADAHRHARGEA